MGSTNFDDVGVRVRVRVGEDHLDAIGGERFVCPLAPARVGRVIDKRGGQIGGKALPDPAEQRQASPLPFGRGGSDQRRGMKGMEEIVPIDQKMVGHMRNVSACVHPCRPHSVARPDLRMRRAPPIGGERSFRQERADAGVCVRSVINPFRESTPCRRLTRPRQRGRSRPTRPGIAVRRYRTAERSP